MSMISHISPRSRSGVPKGQQNRAVAVSGPLPWYRHHHPSAAGESEAQFRFGSAEIHLRFVLRDSSRCHQQVDGVGDSEELFRRPEGTAEESEGCDSGGEPGTGRPVAHDHRGSTTPCR